MFHKNREILSCKIDKSVKNCDQGQEYMRRLFLYISVYFPIEVIYGNVMKIEISIFIYVLPKDCIRYSSKTLVRLKLRWKKESNFIISLIL